MFWWLVDRYIKDKVVKPIPNIPCNLCGKPETDREKIMRSIVEGYTQTTTDNLILQILEIAEADGLTDEWARAQIAAVIRKHLDRQHQVLKKG